MEISWKGKRRYIALLMVIAGVLILIFAPPVVPVVQLPGEHYPEAWKLFGFIPTPSLGLGAMTNTLMGSVVVWILLFALAMYVRARRPKQVEDPVPGGFYNLFEMIFDGLYNFIGGVASGPYRDLIFRVFMTIFLVVLVSNWLEITPGVDAVGFLEPHREKVELADGTETYQFGEGYEVTNLSVGPFDIFHIKAACDWVDPTVTALTEEEQQSRADKGCVTGTSQALPAPVFSEHHEVMGDETTAAGEDQAAAAEDQTAVSSETTAADVGNADAIAAETAPAEAVTANEAEDLAPGDPNAPWVVLPYVRVPSTDLNMTISLAIIAVVMTQIVGFRALGIGYLGKFFNFRTLFTSPLGGIDMAVGFLELIGEFAKLLSFSFRLLGNMFAGSILLFVMSSLLPVIAPWPFFILEFFVAIIQALVFGLLTAIFMNLATQSHHHEEDELAEAH